MPDNMERVSIIRPGDIPGEVETSDVETGEARRYYTRMQYKEKQFLRARDFQAEQEYHIEKMRDNNKALHSYGICENEEGKQGLQVSLCPSKQHEKCVEVSKGSAIDRLGNLILLKETETLDLSSACKVDDKVYVSNILLYISYGTANASDPEYNLDEGGFAGCTRTVEKPEFYVCPANDFAKDTRYLLLASITRNAATGVIDTCNSSPLGREPAGVKVGKVGSYVLGEMSVKNENLDNKAVTADKLGDGAAVANIEGSSVPYAKLQAENIISPVSFTVPATQSFLAFSLPLSPNDINKPLNIQFYSPDQDVRIYSGRIHNDTAVYGFHTIYKNSTDENYTFQGFVCNNNNNNKTIKAVYYFWRLI